MRVDWMAVARECEAPGLRKECAGEVLRELLLAPHGARLEDIGAGGAAAWERLSTDDYRLLLRGMLRAWQAAQRKQLYHEVDVPTMRAVEKRLRRLPNTAMGAARPLQDGAESVCREAPMSVPVSTALAFCLYRDQLMDCLD